MINKNNIKELESQLEKLKKIEERKERLASKKTGDYCYDLDYSSGKITDEFLEDLCCLYNIRRGALCTINLEEIVSACCISNPIERKEVIRKFVHNLPSHQIGYGKDPDPVDDRPGEWIDNNRGRVYFRPYGSNYNLEEDIISKACKDYGFDRSRLNCADRDINNGELENNVRYK
jgi:hypothetical protein